MLRRFSCLVLSVLLLAAPLSATWSIILIDTRTGEIAVGAATCVEGFDLAALAPVIVVGKGAACAQSFVDSTGRNRVLIRNELLAGTDPTTILQRLAQQDAQHRTRQYGIVDASGRAVGFTGSLAQSWSGHRTGRVGSIVWAVQGNVLTGQPVVQAAINALQGSGTLADKLMLAMEAARSLGGDGRCSCNRGAPTACGSPPPSFTKSAHIGCMILARPGDTDGTCSAAHCANGQYYLSLNVANQRQVDPDPVLQLRARFDAWRAALVGKPDHFTSSVEFEHDWLPDDAATATDVRVILRDVNGVRIRRGGAQVRVQPAAGSVPFSVGTVRDHGDGSYTVPLTSGATAGRALLQVTVDDGSGPVQLGPTPELPIRSDLLWVQQSTLSVRRGGTVDFVVRSPNGAQPFLIMASASGSTPGIPLGNNLVLPLRADPLVSITALAAAQFALPGLIGIVPPGGRATTCVRFPPGAFALPPGIELTWAFLLWNPIDTVSNPVTVNFIR